MTKIYLRHNNDYNDIVSCKFGIAKEVLFEGFIYPLIDKKYNIFYSMLFLKLALLVLFLAFIPFPVSLIVALIVFVLINILFSYNYNTIVIDGYLKKGYVPLTRESCDILIKNGIYFRIE